VTAEYGELLLLNPTRARILRAYPFAGAPPHWLLVTDHAVYCGRAGDGALPDSMVARVARGGSAASGSAGFLVHYAPPAATEESVIEATSLRSRPGTWARDTALRALPPEPPSLVGSRLRFAGVMLDATTLAVLRTPS